MTGTPVHLEIKKGEEPVNLKPFPIPVSRWEVFLTEINWLKNIGVLRDDMGSRWATPSFIIPKSDNSVSFLSDFRQLNKKIVRKPYPLPKILDLMQTLQGLHMLLL